MSNFNATFYFIIVGYQLVQQPKMGWHVITYDKYETEFRILLVINSYVLTFFLVHTEQTIYLGPR